FRPMTLPMSSSATWSSMTVPPPSRTTSTFTASGSSTSDLATYPTGPAAASVGPLLPGGRDARVLEQPLDRVGGLRALGQPRLRLVGVDVDLDRLRAGVVVADRLDRPAVAGAAAVGHDHAVARLFGRADPGQPDSDCHVLSSGAWGLCWAPGAG